MDTTVTRKETIHWLMEHPTCSNTDIPEWLLRMSEPLQDPTMRKAEFRELLHVTYIQRKTAYTSRTSISIEDVGTEFELYASRVLFIMDLERQRRDEEFFDFQVEDVFSTDIEVSISFHQGENNGLFYTLDEIVSVLHEDDGKEEMGWPELALKDEEESAIRVDCEHDLSAIMRRFGRTIRRHAHFVRFIFDKDALYGDTLSSKISELLDDFTNVLVDRGVDILESFSVYLDRGLSEAGRRERCLSLYIGRGQERETATMDFLEDFSFASFACLGFAHRNLSDSAEFTAYFSPKEQTLFLNREV